MPYLQQLNRWLVALLVSLVCSTSFDVQATTTFPATYTYALASGVITGGDAAGVCQRYVTWAYDNAGLSRQYVYLDVQAAVCRYYNTTSTAVQSISESVTNNCASFGATLGANSMCVGAPDCPSGQVRDPSGSCGAACSTFSKTTPVAFGTTTEAQFSDPNATFNACYQGCQIHAAGYMAMNAGGSTYASQWNYTGSQCSTAATPTTGPSCADGQVLGTVNGVETCVNAYSVDPNAKANATATGAKTTTNGDGSSSVVSMSTVTNCVGDNACSVTTTTTTTTYNQSGQQTSKTSSSDTKTDSAQALCKSGNAVACSAAGAGGDGSDRSASGGTDCNSAPVCSGDAIDCAVVYQTYQTRCALGKQDATSDLGNAIVAGNDPQSSNMPWQSANVQSHDMSSALDQTELFTASCPADINFSIRGQAVHVPLTTACTWLTWIGNLMVMGCLVLGMRIVGRG